MSEFGLCDHSGCDRTGAYHSTVIVAEQIFDQLVSVVDARNSIGVESRGLTELDNLVLPFIFLTYTLCLAVLQLLWREQPLLNVLRVEAGDHFFEFFRQFCGHIGLAHGRQKAAIVWRLVDKDPASVQFPMSHDLVQQQLRVQVAIPFPDGRCIDLAQELRPLLDPDAVVAAQIQFGLLIPLFNLQHEEHELLVEFLADVTLFMVPLLQLLEV